MVNAWNLRACDSRRSRGDEQAAGPWPVGWHHERRAQPIGGKRSEGVDRGTGTASVQSSPARVNSEVIDFNVEITRFHM
jgi:hypothetical protein